KEDEPAPVEAAQDDESGRGLSVCRRGGHDHRACIVTRHDGLRFDPPSLETQHGIGVGRRLVEGFRRLDRWVVPVHARAPYTSTGPGATAHRAVPCRFSRRPGKSPPVSRFRLPNLSRLSPPASPPPTPVQAVAILLSRRQFLKALGAAAVVAAAP